MHPAILKHIFSWITYYNEQSRIQSIIRIKHIVITLIKCLTNCLIIAETKCGEAIKFNCFLNPWVYVVETNDEVTWG